MLDIFLILKEIQDGFMEYKNYKAKYEFENITLYHVDCMEIMKQTPDKYYDLCIVDPPYGIDINSSGRLGHYGGKGKTWDNQIPNINYFKELFKISKNLIIWGGNYFPLPPTRGIILWDKLQPWDNFSQFEFAWSSFDCPAAKIVISNTGGNIKEYETKIHPTQKPVALYRWLLAKYAKPGDTILDTHLGSGSIVIACLDLGYPLTAFEMDEQYLEPAVKRIENYLKQPKMFKPINKTLNQGSLF